MLAIRLQRTGRSGHAQFRMIVQDRRFSPSGGRIVAYLGSYDPHTKKASIDGEKVSKFLDNGAQPSDRAARLLQKEGIKLPDWVKLDDPKKREVKNPDKRRSTRPSKPESEAQAPAETAPPEAEAAAEASSEAPAKEPAEEAPAEDTSVEEQPAGEPAAEEKPAE